MKHGKECLAPTTVILYKENHIFLDVGFVFLDVRVRVSSPTCRPKGSNSGCF